MSLPDTAFIFILALIIFGPKKLPEIGRQLGRLVGEFRRASNEFKFQIEEELRLADLTDSAKPSQRRMSESSVSEAESTPSSVEPETEYSPSESESSDVKYEEEILPVGQHPNVEYQDHYELNDFEENPTESEPIGDMRGGERADDTAPAIRAADGSEPRTTLPYAGAEPAVPTGEEAQPPTAGDELASSAPVADISLAEAATSTPKHVPADSNAASTIAGVSHG